MIRINKKRNKIMHNCLLLILYEVLLFVLLNILNLLKKKGDCSDILIVKNGFITDTSFSNIIFLKCGRWYTPNTPLLKGTKRAKLLDLGLINERSIRPEEMGNYEKVGLINAMLELGEVVLAVENII